MLNLMYITNDPAVAKIAEDAGVNWIFVDMEFIGKDDRQGGLDTVQNHHTIEDIRIVKAAVKKAKVLVRVNPIHKVHNGYFDSKDGCRFLGKDRIPYHPKDVEEYMAANREEIR